MNPRILKDLLFLVTILVCLLVIKVPFLNIILPAIVVIIYATTNEKRFKSIGLKRPVSWFSSFIQALLLAIVIVLTVMYFIRPAIEYLTQTPINLSIFNSLIGNIRLLLSYIAIGWVIGGICEELIFRGYLLNRITTYLPGKVGIVVSILITSSIFGFLHGYQGISGQLITGILGAILASIYFISGRRLLLTIFTHGLIDTITFILIYFELF
jgi:uncharacterized protein